MQEIVFLGGGKGASPDRHTARCNTCTSAPLRIGTTTYQPTFDHGLVAGAGKDPKREVAHVILHSRVCSTNNGGRRFLQGTTGPT